MSREPEIRPIPSEDIGEDKRFLKLKHHEILFKPPFTCATIGSIGTGKSSFAYSLVNDLYSNYFDEVVVLCSTVDSKSSWENVKQKRVVFLDQYDETSFHTYIKQLEEDQEARKKKGKFPIRVLLVMDDIVFENFNKNKSGVLERLMMTCRHYFVSILLMLQHSKQISPAMRNQIMFWVLFRLTTNDLKKVSSEHGNLLTNDEFEHMYHDVQQKGKHEFLIINYKKPMNERFSHRFTQTIDQSKYTSRVDASSHQPTTRLSSLAPNTGVSHV